MDQGDDPEWQGKMKLLSAAILIACVPLSTVTARFEAGKEALRGFEPLQLVQCLAQAPLKRHLVA